MIKVHTLKMPIYYGDAKEDYILIQVAYDVKKLQYDDMGNQLWKDVKEGLKSWQWDNKDENIEEVFNEGFGKRKRHKPGLFEKFSIAVANI